MNWYVLIDDDGLCYVATDDEIDKVRHNLADNKHMQELGPMTTEEAFKLVTTANHEWMRKINKRLIDLIL